MLAFLHIAVEGMITTLVGELEDLRWASPEQAIARASEHPDMIVGIKVGSATRWLATTRVLPAAARQAPRLGLPLMVHSSTCDRRSLGCSAPGPRATSFTHCFHANEGGVLDPSAGWNFPRSAGPGARGPVDIGDGIGQLRLIGGQAVFAQDFPPDTVSSDLHAHNVGRPCYRPGHHAVEADALRE